MAPESKARIAAVPLRILVVDDHKDSADVLATLLRLSGNLVAIAYDGTSALAAVEDFRPQIVFLDIDLPDMSGYEVGARLRQHCESLLMIASTARGTAEDRLFSRMMGFDHHLQKPYEIDQIRDVLGLRGAG